jgi:hypothetical protein
MLSETSDASMRWKVLGIAVALFLIETTVSMRATNIVMPLVALALTSIGVAVALEIWCKLPRATAIKIAAIFVGIRLVLAVGATWLFSETNAAAS